MSVTVSVKAAVYVTIVDCNKSVGQALYSQFNIEGDTAFLRGQVILIAKYKLIWSQEIQEKTSHWESQDNRRKYVLPWNPHPIPAHMLLCLQWSGVCSCFHIPTHALSHRSDLGFEPILTTYTVIFIIYLSSIIICCTLFKIYFYAWVFACVCVSALCVCVPDIPKPGTLQLRTVVSHYVEWWELNLGPLQEKQVL